MFIATSSSEKPPADESSDDAITKTESKKRKVKFQRAEKKVERSWPYRKERFSDEESLFPFYDADVNVDDDDDSEVASVNCESLEEFPTESPDFMPEKIGFARCDSIGASALDPLHIDDEVKYSPSTFDRRLERTFGLTPPRKTRG